MNILILNGNPDRDNVAFDVYIHGYQLMLHKMGHYVKFYQLRDLKIAGIEKSDEIPAAKAYCTDDVTYINNSLRETDLVVMASPLIQGFPSVLMKIVQDRINRALQDELSAGKANRTSSSSILHIPLMGVILQKEPDTTQQEILLNRLMQERIAANLMTLLSLFLTTETSLTHAVCETFSSTRYQLSVDNTCEDFLRHPLGDEHEKPGDFRQPG
jgi:multimeric flavodoxin WrbA